MSANLIIHDASDPASPDASLGMRWENLAGTPLVSATALDNGQAVAGVYTLTLTVGAAVTVEVRAADGSKNPHQASAKVITADGSTQHDNLVPGVSLIFQSTPSTGWRAVVSIGALLSPGGTAIRRLDAGILTEGTTTEGVRLACVNVGSEDSAETTVQAWPGWFVTGGDPHRFIARIANHSESARRGLAAESIRTITFSSWSNGTGPDTGFKVADVFVNGSLAITRARFDGQTRYQYGSGNGYFDGNDALSGIGLVLALTDADPTSATIELHIRNGYEWVELAPDVSGAPGTWTQAPITLTEPGEIAGTITTSGMAFFWKRERLPTAEQVGPIRCWNLLARGLTV